MEAGEAITESRGNAHKLEVVAASLQRGGRAGGIGAVRPVLRDVSFSVRSGEAFGIIGPSGAGKTTLLRLLNGLETPDRGSVLVDGEDVARMDVLDLRRRVGMVFQSPALFPGTVGSNVCYSLAIRGIPDDERECRGLACLGRVGLWDEFWDRSASELSQGEQQRVAIARALVNEPEVLLMDEPTSALDPTSASRILSVVRSLNRDVGVTIVFVTHLMHQAREVCDRALVLVGGRSVEEGHVPGLFEDPRSELTRRFIAGELDAGSGTPGGGPDCGRADCGPAGEGGA